jgi:cytochrome P450
MNFVVGDLARDSSAYIKYANAQMEERIAAERDTSKQTRTDFMHYLLHAKDPQTDRGFTTTELNADASLLIAAGSDTTAGTLSAALFYLLHYPAALARATNEARGAFTSIDEIRGGKALNGLLYLRACVDETMRLSPPVPAHLPREVLSSGLTIDGHYFPKGTVVGTAPYAIHHCPLYYPEPFVFRPERWIVDEKAEGGASAESVAIARAAFCPFSLGPRGCIGKSVAYHEVMIALVNLLFLYDIRLPKDIGEQEPSGEGRPNHKHWGRRKKEEYQLVEYFGTERKGPMVEFRWRGLS